VNGLNFGLPRHTQHAPKRSAGLRHRNDEEEFHPPSVPSPRTLKGTRGREELYGLGASGGHRKTHNYFLILFKFKLDNKFLKELVFNKSD